MITRRRGTVAIAAGVVAIGCLTLASPARAAVTKGSFASPAAGATVSGVVQVVFDTHATSVDISYDAAADNPGPNQDSSSGGETPSGGSVTVSWDTSKFRDGDWDLEAQECDPTGCDVVTEQVTVGNPLPPTSTSAHFSVPDGATVADNSTLTVTGPGSGRLVVSAPTYGEQPPAYPPTTASGDLPLSVTVPYYDDDPAYTAQPIDVSFVLAGSTDSISEVLNVLPGPVDYSQQPKPIAYAAGSTYYPSSDGFEDGFRVRVAVTQPVTVTLHIVSAGVPVASGAVDARPPTKFELQRAAAEGIAPTYVEAGAGLPPGKYGWFLSVQGPGDPRAALITPTRTVTALPGRASIHTLSFHRSFRAYHYRDDSGRCSGTAVRGAGLTLTSDGRCSAGGVAGVALATFTATLKRQVGFNRITIKVALSGGPVILLVYDPVREFLEPPLVIEGRGGHVTLPAEVINSRDQVQFALETADGFHATVTSVTLVPAYYTIAS